MPSPIENPVLFERNVAFAGFLLHSLTQIAHIWCPIDEMAQRFLSIPDRLFTKERLIQGTMPDFVTQIFEFKERNRENFTKERI